LVTQQIDKAAISSSDSDNGEESDNLAEASQAEKDLELINHPGQEYWSYSLAGKK
jgi:hypothetical protein